MARSPAAQEPTGLVLPGGTVNLGAPPGEKGAWELAYIENMADVCEENNKYIQNLQDDFGTPILKLK